MIVTVTPSSKANLKKYASLSTQRLHYIILNIYILSDIFKSGKIDAISKSPFYVFIKSIYKKNPIELRNNKECALCKKKTLQ